MTLTSDSPEQHGRGDDRHRPGDTASAPQPEADRHAVTEPDGPDELLHELARFRRRILRRDLVESLAAGLVIAGFAGALRGGGFPWLAECGLVIILAGAVEILIVLHWARMARPTVTIKMKEPGRVGRSNQTGRGARSNASDTGSPALWIERRWLERQIGLLRNVSWWYTGPLMLGCSVFVTGIIVGVPALPVWLSAAILTGFAVCFSLVVWIVHGINRRAIQARFEPLRRAVIERQSQCSAL